MDDNHHGNILGENDDYYDDDSQSHSEGTLEGEEDEPDIHDDEMDNANENALQIEATRQPFEMTPNHSKILILISKYGKTATAEDPEESWIRQLPLTVMIYEGITAGAIDCDYAPKSLIISSDGPHRSYTARIAAHHHPRHLYGMRCVRNEVYGIYYLIPDSP